MMKQSGAITVASALAGMALPSVHAGENNTIQVALVGCGGRGSGAAVNALSVKEGPTKLVAMADVFTDRLDSSYQEIQRDKAKLGFAGQIDVPPDRKFIGFDGYKKAIDVLRPGDVVILATPPAFRWVHFTYAIEKGINVFMEKPVGVDGPACKKMFKLAEESVKKNMKVGVGLMCRHCEARGEMQQRIKDGAIGDLVLLRAYRLAGPTGNMPVRQRKQDQNELEFQIRNFYGFLWASGGAY